MSECGPITATLALRSAKACRIGRPVLRAVQFRPAIPARHPFCLLTQSQVWRSSLLRIGNVLLLTRPKPWSLHCPHTVVYLPPTTVGCTTTWRCSSRRAVVNNPRAARRLHCLHILPYHYTAPAYILPPVTRSSCIAHLLYSTTHVDRRRLAFDQQISVSETQNVAISAGRQLYFTSSHAD